MVVSSDVWLPSGSLIRTVTVAEIRARKARAGRGVSKDAVDGAAISATTLDPKGSFGPKCNENPTSQMARQGRSASQYRLTSWDN